MGCINHLLVNPAEDRATAQRNGHGCRLQRLRTDYVDIFHLHGVLAEQYDHCARVLVPELIRARDAGNVRFLGITERFGVDTRHTMLARALPGDLFDIVMVDHNLVNPSARHRVFPLTRRYDVGT
jgi:predicted aldo/keto reductase-like oxidoreductase